jgi:predicted dienelactone hydrolase
MRMKRTRVKRWVLGTLIAVFVVSAALVTTVAVARERPRTLPAPSGAHKVGRTTREWTDSTRTDPFAPEPNQRRRLSVWLWYPAADSTTGRTAAYAPGPWEHLRQQGFLAGPLDAIRTNAFDDAPAAEGRFPLVVLEPGLGLSAPQFTTIAQELASQGFVVAGVTPTYSANVTVLGGQVVERTAKGNPEDQTPQALTGLVQVWSEDARFAAAQIARDPLAFHVEPGRTAYIGHSLGGAASLQACHDDPDCAGAADLDGTPYGPVAATGLTRPFLILSAQAGCQTEECRRLLSASAGPHWAYAVAGAQHFNFTDYAVYFLAPPLTNLLGQLGSINGRRGLVITGACLVAFLDHVLRGGPAPDHLDARFPELSVH